MAEMGYCPSGRLFEAAACGTPILSDMWEGLDQFFEPGRDILLARTTDEALDAIDRPADELARIGTAARQRGGVMRRDLPRGTSGCARRLGSVRRIEVKQAC